MCVHVRVCDEHESKEIKRVRPCVCAKKLRAGGARGFQKLAAATTTGRMRAFSRLCVRVL